MTVRVLFIALLLSGCSSPQSAIPESEIGQLIVFSIDGRDKREAVKIDEFFHGYPVLGKIELKEAAQRQEIMSALLDGIKRRPEFPAKCFWPRHGIRIVANQKMTDYVICFQCDSYKKFENDESSRSQTINPDIQPVFDRVLENASIRLAPSGP